MAKTGLLYSQPSRTRGAQLLAGVSMIALSAAVSSPAYAQTSYTGGNGGAWGTNSNWTNQAPTGGVNATVSNGATVDTDGGDAVASLTVGPAAGSGVDVLTGATLFVGGPSISNTGQIGLNGALELTGDVALSGSGTLTMTGSTSPGSTGQIGTNGNGYTLTNQSTIQGSGLIGSNAVTFQNLSLNNSGTINANSTADALQIGGTGGSIVNSGMLKATAGGGLILATQAPVGNGGGTILASGAGSTVTIGTTIQGGTLTTTNQGVMQTASGGATLDAASAGAITLTDGSTYTSTAGTTFITGKLNLGTATGSTLTLGGALELTGDTTLSGPGGVVNISGNAAGSTGGQIGTNGNGYMLTNNVTIQGTGVIGSNNTTYQNLGLTNNGVINADTNGQTLSIQGNGGPIVNAGLFEATAGGVLNLATQQAINNQAGAITAAGAGSAVNVGTTIQGGTLNTSAGGVVQTASGGATLDGATLGAITVSDGSTYTSTAGTTFVTGALNLGTVHGGTLALGGALDLTGDTTLSGPGGVVNITGNAGASTGGQIGTNGNGYTLTNDVTIQGTGVIGSNNTTYQNLNLTNNATINADTSGQTLSIQGNGGSIVNAGVLKATGGGLLNLSTQAPVGNGGGTILASGAGSTVTIGTTIQGGKLTTTKQGVIQTAAGGATLDAASAGGITLTDGSTYTSTAGTTFITGKLNLGTATGSTLTLGGALELIGDTTLAGHGGVVNISGNASASTGGQIGTNGNGYMLTNDVTIQGTGVIGSNNTTYQNLGLTNNGTINADTSGQTLSIQGNGGPIVNAGLFEATGGGVLNLATQQPVDNQAGAITAAGAGSAVNVSTTIQGGTLNTSAGGVVQTSGTAQLDGTTHGAITISDGSTYTSGAAAFTQVTGTLNLGTVAGGALALSGQLQLASDVTLAGPGAVNLSGAAQIGTNGSGYVLTNQSTIQGTGLLGSNVGALYQNGSVNNQGLILATGGVLTVHETDGITNSGTLQAGANSTLAVTSPLANVSGGTLAGGTYRADAGGTLALSTGPITSNAATIILNGAGSTLTTPAGTIETQLAGNTAAGTLSVLGGRSYTTAVAFANAGQINLGGGTFAALPLTNLASGTVTGFGTVANVDASQLSNAGAVTASGGKLSLANGATGAGGTLQSNAGATLDLSGATAASSAGKLANNGALALGGQNVLVSTDYTNASFGTGNAFNAHGGVTGTGLILANGDTKLVVSGAGITGGGSTLALGNFHTSGGAGGTFTIANGGTDGPVLRGAVQTTGLTNPAIGLTAANFGPLAAGASTTESITVAPASAGALTGQSFKVVTNFDNVAAKTVSVTGAAYDYANPVLNTAQPVNLGNFHVGAAPAQAAVSISNATVSNAAYQEGLDVATGSATGAATSNAGTVSLLAAGATNATAIKVGLTGATAGVETGSVSLGLVSDGAGTSGLGKTALASQSVAVTGTAYNLAGSSTIAPVSFGVLHTGTGTQTRTLSVTNTAPTGAYSEGLDSSFGAYVNGGGSILATGAGAVTNLAAGSTDASSLKVSISTATAGTVSGTITVHQASDGAVDGLADTALADQSPAVSGTVQATVTNLATPQINTAQPVAFGAVRIGTAVPSQALSITNAAPVSQYSEGLIASVTGTSGAGVTASGGFGAPGASLAAGATNTAGVLVGIDTSTAGAKSGAAVIDFKSDGTAYQGGTVTDLGPTSVAGTGAVYRLASPTLNTPTVTLAARVGDAAPGASVSLSNTSPDAYTEGLKASLGAATGPFTSTGTISNLAASQTDASSLKVALSTAASGTFTGSASVTLASTGAGTDGASDLALASQSVALTGKVYTTAVASVSPTVSFGIVHVGDAATSQAVAVGNVATGALTDTLRGGFGTVSGPFSGSGTLAGVAAGTTGNLSVGLNTSVAGVYGGQATLALSSHDADLADVSIAGGPVSLSAQVNNYAAAAFLKTAGSGALSGAATSYTLNFGTLVQGGAAETADLALANAVTGPADVLSGGFATTAADFWFTGLAAFADLAAEGQHAVDVTLGTSTVGMFDETLTFDGSGGNASGYVGPNQEIVLTLEGDVVASGGGGGGGGPTPAPEPGALAVFGTALLGLLGFARRRAA